MIKKVNSYLSALSWLSSLKELDWNIGYEIKVAKIENKRTLASNRLYWLYLTCISQETGNDKNDLHEFFKHKYCYWNEINMFNESLITIKSTTTLTTKQFTEYIEKIIIFACTELGITLPNPDDIKFIQFEEYYLQYL
jgi:hypothetical protein